MAERTIKPRNDEWRPVGRGSCAPVFSIVQETAGTSLGGTSLGRKRQAPLLAAMRASLTNQGELQASKESFELTRLQNRKRPHPSGHLHVLDTDELRFQDRLSILKKHGDDLSKILLQLV